MLEYRLTFNTDNNGIDYRLQEQFFVRRLPGIGTKTKSWSMKFSIVI